MYTENECLHIVVRVLLPFHSQFKYLLPFPSLSFFPFLPVPSFSFKSISNCPAFVIVAWVQAFPQAMSRPLLGLVHYQLKPLRAGTCCQLPLSCLLLSFHPSVVTVARGFVKRPGFAHHLVSQVTSTLRVVQNIWLLATENLYC